MTIDPQPLSLHQPKPHQEVVLGKTQGRLDVGDGHRHRPGLQGAHAAGSDERSEHHVVAWRDDLGEGGKGGNDAATWRWRPCKRGREPTEWVPRLDAAAKA